jgi:hypothetical protein
MQVSETDIQAHQGILKPYSASEIASSPLSENEILTHRCYPGLSGVVSSAVGRVAVFFVDKLPVCEMVYGRATATVRQTPDEFGEMVQVGATLVHVQNHYEGWHFLSHDQDASEVSVTSVVVFLEWKPGSLNAALKEHDEMFLRADLSEADLLVGSDFEKESLSRFYLSTGMSSFANSHQASGVIDKLLASPFKSTIIRSASAGRGIAIPTAWTEAHD